MAIGDNLVAAWELNEASGDAVDSFGANTMTETSGTIAAGADSSRDFEAGDTEYFQLNDNAAMSTGDIDFSFEIWMNPESLSGFAVPLSKATGSLASQKEFLLLFINATLVWQVSDGVSTTAQVGSGVLTTGIWTQVICWHDSVNNVAAICYNDGTPETLSHTTGCWDGSSAFRLGTENAAYYYDGLMKRVRFWKKVLSSTERTFLYNSGTGRSYAELVPAVGTIIPQIMHHRKLMVA